MWHLLKDMRKKDKGLAFLAVLLIAGQVFLDLKLPDYTKEITVLISSESNTISDYLLSGGKMLACALGSALLAVIVGYLAAKIAADFSHNVRGKVFHKVFDFGAGEISKFSTSSLITRYHADPDARSHGTAGDDQSTDHGSLGDREDCRQELAVIRSDGISSRADHGRDRNPDGSVASEIQDCTETGR